MIQRFSARARCIDKDLQIRANLGLTDELRQNLRPERSFRLIVVPLGRG
jgi:hypothetical protein